MRYLVFVENKGKLNKTIQSFQNFNSEDYDKIILFYKNYYDIDGISVKGKSRFYYKECDKFKIDEKKRYLDDYIDISKITNLLIISSDIIFIKPLPKLTGNTSFTRLNHCNLDLDDKYVRFEFLNYIFKDKTNPHPRKSANFISENYCDYDAFPKTFSIKFSYISDIKEKFPLFYNSLEEREYGLKTKLSYTKYRYAMNPHSLSIKKEEVTLVTAFYLINQKVKKHKYDYLKKAKDTLSVKQNMVIFIQDIYYDEVKKIREELGLLDKTKIIKLELKDFYMIDKKEELEKCVKNNKAPYDNYLYILAVNSRYKYLEKTMNENYFNTKYFGWIDFGLSHIVTVDKSKILTYNEDKIRIAWIARKKKDGSFLYNHTALAGGIYVGSEYIMRKLIEIHDIEFRKNMENGYIVNDDKVLFLIMMKYPEMFDTFFSGYAHIFCKL